MYVSQIQHGQLLAFHFFIAFLNPDKVSIFLITDGSSSQSLGPNKMQIRYHGKHCESVE